MPPGGYTFLAGDAMRCPECRADLAADALFCPECGANPHLEPGRPATSQVERPAVSDAERPAVSGAERRAGCRRLFPLVWAALALVLALVLLALAAWLGLREGEKRWQANAEATADAEFARCQVYLAEGRWALAAAACREADRLKPGYPGAVELYATAVIALTPQPTPTIAIIERAAQDIFADAQESFNSQDWRGTLETLNELWKFDPAYRAEEADQMRHTALVALGRQALDEGWLEEAIYYLDQAAAFGPLDPPMETERQLAARYASAVNFCGVDWQECTTRLTELYTAYPDYRDLFDRLVNAYLEWAEAMANLQEWCPAEVQYGQALRLRPDAGLEAKRADAAQRCLLATPTPIPGQITGTITLTVEGFSVGRLAYSAYNGDLGVYELYVLSAYDQSLSELASSAGQPSWRRDGGALAYRGVMGLQAIPTAGGDPVTLVSDAAAFWPTWSPDGTRLAYARQEAEGWRIYVAPVDGSSEPQPLTLGKYPLWGPQGALAFSGCSVDGTVWGVCIIDPDAPAAVPVALTANPNDTPVSWSPDGGNIAYMSDHGGDWDVFLVNTAGGVVLLTLDDEAPASDGLPAWAPDGGAIAFVSDREGSWGLYLMSPDGSNVRKALNIGAQHPNWLMERLSWGP
jgi:tetratricopeptide (TPR) repeat protein